MDKGIDEAGQNGRATERDPLLPKDKKDKEQFQELAREEEHKNPYVNSMRYVI